MRRNKDAIRIERAADRIAEDAAYISDVLLPKAEAAMEASKEDGYEIERNQWPPMIRPGSGSGDPTGSLVASTGAERQRAKRKDAERLIRQASKNIEDAKKKVEAATKDLLTALQKVNPPRLVQEGIDYEA